MTKWFYLAPPAAFDSLTNANHRAVHLTADVAFGFVEFVDQSGRDAFVALSGVIEFPHHRSTGKLPAAALTALAAHGVVAGDNAVDVAMKIARKFGGMSHDEILA